MRICRSLLIALAFAVPGCADSVNLDACQRFELYFASLPCAAGLDDGLDCPALASYPCETRNYYECLITNHACDVDNNLLSTPEVCEIRCDE